MTLNNRQRAGDKSSKPVDQYIAETGEWITWRNATDAAEALGSMHARRGIRQVCKGKGKTCEGYKWRYTDPEHRPE